MSNSELQTRIPKFKCPYCGQKFKIISTLKRHIIIKHLQYNCSCPYCNKEFESLNELKTHLYNLNDEYHWNLYNLISRKHLKFVDKKFFMENEVI